MEAILATGPMGLLKEYHRVLADKGIEARIVGPPDGNPNA